jgi:Amt family ammonium transporter
MVGFCSGTIAGLVAATPASGFIPPWASVVLGVVTGAVCNYSTKSECYSLAFSPQCTNWNDPVKYLIGIDDALDLFAEHAMGGILGLLANGLFADNAIIALDDVNTAVPGKSNTCSVTQS